MIRKFFHLIFVLLILALIIGVPASWMIYRSYNDPEAHYFYTEKAEGEESLRFAVISDLFGYVFEGGNGVIADQVSNTYPDAILIGGNMISAQTEDITPLTDLIKRLSQIAPVYYSYGEQELKYVKKHASENGAAEQTDQLRSALSDAGAVVLNEEYTDVSLYGIDTRIGGMFNNAYEMTGLDHKVKKRYESTYKFLTEYQDTDRFKIMLSSRPESFVYADACDTWKVDLVVSGNDLGGLVVIPYYGGLFGGSQGYFPEYIHGMYEKGDVKLFITSGLSAPGKPLTKDNPVPRFNNPPEIAILDISGLTRTGDAAPQEAAKEEQKQAPETEQQTPKEEQQEPESGQETESDQETETDRESEEE